MNFIARYTNGKTRRITANHSGQAGVVALKIARIYGWNLISLGKI